MKPLSINDVYKKCQLDGFKFKSTEEFAPFNQIIKQDRAIDAITFGLKIKESDYNIFVAGERGTGKSTILRSFLEEIAKKSEPQKDWVYVYNFVEPEVPKAISLPQGKAKNLKHAVDEFIDTLSVEIPQALESKDYEDRINQILVGSRDIENSLYNSMEKKANEFEFSIKYTKVGFLVIPIVEGKPLSDKEFSELEPNRKKEIETRRKKFEPILADSIRKIRHNEKETKERISKIQKEVANFIISQNLEDVIFEFKEFDEILKFIDSMKSHLIDHLAVFLGHANTPSLGPGPGKGDGDKKSPLIEYTVNVFVDNTRAEGAPVIYEPNPTYYNMFGKIERKVENGIYFTDFTMIRPGALSKANGGYLVVDANNVLMNFGVWEALKRLVKNKELVIEDLADQYSLFPTSGIKPQPIPLELKIIMIGTPWIYQMLYTYDEDFKKMFKIKAEFDYEMKFSKDNVKQYIGFIAAQCKKKDLLHLNKDGAEALLEHAMRIADHQGRISLHLNETVDVLVEADQHAKSAKAKLINRNHVEKSIEKRHWRLNLFEEKTQEMIEEGTYLFDFAGSKVGQINGLAVYQLGGHSFGKPNRITSETFIGGRGHVINIERESDLSGNIHNKGVLILSGFLSSIFAKEKPLSLSASIAFEQSYGGIDGDSASAAEAIAILSSMSDTPIKQGIAITGSINQKGEIQPIGGANEKIEGFFDACNLFGLDKKQGVIIPIQNVKNLMIAPRVREAIKNKKFNIYAVKTVEEALKILTGKDLGITSKGTFKKGSVAAIIQHKIATIEKKLKSKGKGKKTNANSNNEKEAKLKTKPRTKSNLKSKAKKSPKKGTSKKVKGKKKVPTKKKKARKTRRRSKR